MVESDNSRHSSRQAAAGRLSALMSLAVFIRLCLQAYAGVGTPRFFTLEWVPGLGVHLDFAVDGLSVLFALIICAIGVFVVIFSADYMEGHRHYGRFFRGF